MFDIGFSELMVIAVVALIVIGPEKLPKVARTVGHLFGRMQRYVNDVKSDISREMALDDLRKLQSSMQDTVRSVEQSVNEEVRSAESEMNKIAADVPAAGTDAPSAAVPGAVAAPDPVKPA
ncbi:MAG: Sec-independent protein translocase protein TatB [Burkholderiales bacterium]|nr:Sec-independent protein translocase protein TatB [Burkholderiales bacterium]